MVHIFKYCRENGENFSWLKQLKTIPETIKYKCASLRYRVQLQLWQPTGRKENRCTAGAEQHAESVPYHTYSLKYKISPSQLRQKACWYVAFCIWLLGLGPSESRLFVIVVIQTSVTQTCFPEDFTPPFHPHPIIFFSIETWLLDTTQEAKYVESWPNTTSAWASWSRFDIPVDRYDGVHSLLICTSSTLGSPTCHQASQQENTY